MTMAGNGETMIDILRDQHRQIRAVHPVARRTGAGSLVVDDRLREESEAKREPASLSDLGVDHPEFDEKIRLLSAAIQSHARHEEAEEFPSVLRQHSPAAPLPAGYDRTRDAVPALSRTSLR